jgi:hypothetical protein
MKKRNSGLIIIFQPNTVPFTAELYLVQANLDLKKTHLSFLKQTMFDLKKIYVLRGHP